MDNFEIIAKIGEGAYSTVYTVKRKLDGLLYALKKVKMKNLSEKEKKNALNEVRILASVKSPYVISYKESFIDELDSTLCIVMEYADEGDLFQKITLYKNRHCNFEEIDIWRIFIQIAKGLRDLHEYNILHRDMKSANVFLFRDGRAKLGDLNVSKVAHRGLGCTQTGTPYYASPEVWKDNPYDNKSDIWGLGCVTYEMCMLRTPFRADSMNDLFQKIIKGEYFRVNKKYSEELDFVISLLLQVNPIQRPTAKEIFDIEEVKDKIEEFDIGTNEEMGKNKKDKVEKVRREFRGINEKTNNEGRLLYYNEDEIKEENENENEGESERKWVIDTIKMPKKLAYLENRLPIANYEMDMKMEKDMNNAAWTNRNLPIINNNRYIQGQGKNKMNTIQFKLKRNLYPNPCKLNRIIEVYIYFYLMLFIEKIRIRKLGLKVLIDLRT